MILKFIFALFALVLSAACGAGESQEEQHEYQPIALVRGQPIVRKEFNDFLSLRQDVSEVESVRLERRALFHEFLTEQLLLQEASRENITLEKDEVEDQLDRWLSDGQHVTPALVERVRTFLKIQKFVRTKIVSQISVDLQEMQNYYEDNKQQLIIEDQAHVLEIMLDNRERAEEIREELRFGDVRTFKETARRYSSGLAAETGGDLGTFERGELPEDFEKVIFKLKPGEISPVFRSGQGYHIFMLEEWIPRHAQKFYEVQDAIFRTIVAEKERAALDQYVNQLFQNASVQIFDGELDWRDSGENLE